MTNTFKAPRTAPSAAANTDFQWRQCWYPVALAIDVPRDRPYGFSIYGEGCVLFRDDGDRWVCLVDRCPHRAAKLSDGQLIDGKIECLYHGWQFGENGVCVKIPQLEAEAKIPKTACARSHVILERQGILWVWPGEPRDADETKLPLVDDLDAPGVTVIDTVADFPYDQTLLVENLLDPAHVYISHDRTELNIRRENAQPLEMEVLSADSGGFQGRFRGQTAPNRPWTKLDFIKNFGLKTPPF